jgi:hypothetical protein
MEEIKKYLSNPFVLAGLVGLGFYLYKRKELLIEQPEAKKSVKELETDSILPTTETEQEDSFDGVPKDLKRDAREMDSQTLKRTIITNQKMLKRARLSDKKREQIKKALNYLKREYKSRN